MFNRARLKLTIYYLLIIMFVSIAFSAVIYRAVGRELTRFGHMQRLRLSQQFLRLPGGGVPLPAIDQDLLTEVRRRLLISLALVNGVILVSAGGMGYFLAGKTLAPIKTMVEDQNQFISDASHELKTPLTALKTAAEVSLRDKNLSLAAAKKLIRENIDEVDKLQSLTEGLLTLARYENNHRMKTEKVSLAALVKAAVRRVAPQAKTKKIAIKSKVASTFISGDAESLTDVLVILLDNAVKYSPPGKPVEISGQKTDGGVLVSVKDQGIGIADKDLPRIFDRFYRADLARAKSGSGGYGLGLSIAKKIAAAHAGAITVQSKLGQGSKFTLRLPIRRSA